jgi:serpin B
LVLALLVPGPVRSDVSGQDNESAAKAINAFALDLYGKIRKPEGNLIFSPYSISMALAMAYNGGRGRP